MPRAGESEQPTERKDLPLKVPVEEHGAEGLASLDYEHLAQTKGSPIEGEARSTILGARAARW